MEIEMRCHDCDCVVGYVDVEYRSVGAKQSVGGFSLTYKGYGNIKHDWIGIDLRFGREETGGKVDGYIMPFCSTEHFRNFLMAAGIDDEYIDDIMKSGGKYNDDTEDRYTKSEPIEIKPMVVVESLQDLANVKYVKDGKVFYHGD